MIKSELHFIQGMQRDLTISKFNPNFCFEANNIRLTAREGNTLLSVTNEKGTKECTLKDTEGTEISIQGNYLGHCILNNYLVLFTTPSYGYGNIYRLENKGDYFEAFLLYESYLNTFVDYPIETLGIVEGDKIYKVYWTDNFNPIRVINIATEEKYDSSYNFNLVKFSSCSNLTISKMFGSGNFSSGVIQYACTYYSLYGSESNIFALSDLNYCSFEDRGAAPDESVQCSFKITSSKSYTIRTDYEYIRIYSIHRSSLNAVPLVKIVADIRTDNIPVDNSGEYLFYIDNGTSGELVDSTILLYIGGENLIAKTISSKDNTLFAGNIKLVKKIIPEDIRAKLKNCKIQFKNSSYFPLNSDSKAYYPTLNLLTYLSSKIRGFKSNECYRFGILFKSETGNWSEVIFIEDATCLTFPSISTSSISLNLSIPIAYTTIPEEVVRWLITNGYISMRGVCVYPDFNDRNVICLGVLCPTVFNLLDRVTDSPYAQSSWFTRPTPSNTDYIKEYFATDVEGQTYIRPTHNIKGGEVLFFNHMDNIYGGRTYKETPKTEMYEYSRGEIQSGTLCGPYKIGNGINTISKNRSAFFVDSGIVTMYSPDIEFDTSVGYMKDANYKLRIVGMVKLANTLSDISITTSTTGYHPEDTGFFGNYIELLNLYKGAYYTNRSGKCMCAAPFWSALPKFKVESTKDNFLWLVYPWHRSGSLIASGVPEEGEKRLWELKRKVMSNLWISYSTTFLTSPYEPISGISPVNTWHSGDGLIKIKAINHPDRLYYTYYGDVDKVISYNSYDNKKVDSDNNEYYGYDIYAVNSNPSKVSDEYMFSYFNQNANNIIDYKYGSSSLYTKLNLKDCIGTEPVSMKYKSGPHAVFAFNYVDTTIGDTSVKMLYILPNNGVVTNDASDSYSIFLWDNLNTTWKQDTILLDSNHAFLWLGELYRDTVENRFGGNTEEAILNNTWEIASDEVKLDSIKNLLISYYGDTYTQRYDALRTYEYTSEDTNSIVDILSFICETRINLDGRYDRNRGNISNLTVTPLNFNLLNPVYSLRDNYFNYHTLDYKRFSNSYFPNTIVWSKEKSNAEEIDSWSNLNMLSSLDLDGDKGEIESLNTFNNEIYCFQKKGLSNILFNSRVLIPVSDGVPIEMTNGLKVSGKRYISNTIGCSNKWSIAETSAGLYFIDNETNSLYLFNGLVQSLSDKLGFRLWIGENNSHELWDPINYKNFRTYYDKNNDDVYFINDKTCLCYSELLNQFTSFMSYEKVPAMFNINSEFYSFNKGKLWHNFEGDYNMFYGEFKPYSLTVVANSDEPYDKIFNTVEFRSDSWNNDELINNQTFDTLEVWNEYLHGKSTLVNVLGRPSALKKKFRVWRANIPRDDSNHRDRIRNTWAYVKLSMNTPNTWRTEFHDMNIHYFI